MDARLQQWIAANVANGLNEHAMNIAQMEQLVQYLQGLNEYAMNIAQWEQYVQYLQGLLNPPVVVPGIPAPVLPYAPNPEYVMAMNNHVPIQQPEPAPQPAPQPAQIGVGPDPLLMDAYANIPLTVLLSYMMPPQQQAEVNVEEDAPTASDME